MGACETSVPWEPWLSTWIRPSCSGNCLLLPTTTYPTSYPISRQRCTTCWKGIYQSCCPLLLGFYICLQNRCPPPLGPKRAQFLQKNVSSRLLLEQNKGREGRLWVKIETDRLFSCFAPFGRPALCIFAYYPLLRHNLLCHAKQY